MRGNSDSIFKNLASKTSNFAGKTGNLASKRIITPWRMRFEEELRRPWMKISLQSYIVIKKEPVSMD